MLLSLFGWVVLFGMVAPFGTVPISFGEAAAWCHREIPDGMTGNAAKSVVVFVEDFDTYLAELMG